MRTLLSIVWLTVLAPVVSAQSSDATDALLASLGDITHLQGAFLQRQYTDDKALLVESSGRFQLLRPGYFSWEIQSPDRQLIIASPEYIWHHDIDLETVTRRPVNESAEMSPLQVLGGDESVLRERFSVIQGAEGEFTLTPVLGDPGFERLTLRLAGKTITGMEILDKLNQRVVITFDELDGDTVLRPDDFAFKPPEEADQFFYDE